jgi:hypothetical protein
VGYIVVHYLRGRAARKRSPRFTDDNNQRLQYITRQWVMVGRGALRVGGRGQPELLYRLDESTCPPHILSSAPTFTSGSSPADRLYQAIKGQGFLAPRKARGLAGNMNGVTFKAALKALEERALVEYGPEHKQFRVVLPPAPVQSA